MIENCTPISLKLVFYFKILKHEKNKKNGYPVIKKPDIDNLIKFILDAGNGFLFYDDSQIYEISAKKIYGDDFKTEITIEY